jgi:hypothetical protein
MTPLIQLFQRDSPHTETHYAPHPFPTTNLSDISPLPTFHLPYSRHLYFLPSTHLQPSNLIRFSSNTSLAYWSHPRFPVVATVYLQLRPQTNHPLYMRMHRTVGLFFFVWSVKIGPTGSSETSINSLCTLRNYPKPGNNTYLTVKA